MKKIIISALFFISLCFSLVNAQPFYGFQSIGRHSWTLGLKWDGKASLSLGYIYRSGGGTSFRDFSAEWQFPFEESFQLKNAQLVAGMYAPIRQRGRPFVALGIHGRLLRKNDGKSQLSSYKLAVTGMPSYTFSGRLSERPYLTAGTRFSYVLTCYETTTEPMASRILPYHGAELGAHLDMILERSVGIGVNAYFRRNWGLKSKDEVPDDEWEKAGDVYLGPTYFLRRW
ncbi:MAG: hypothetical protein MRZ79_04630 [Bacteroidia bacterium]|nr:hypothetical protein [Bacteroidia bacterium]